MRALWRRPHVRSWHKSAESYAKASHSYRAKRKTRQRGVRNVPPPRKCVNSPRHGHARQERPCPPYHQRIVTNGVIPSRNLGNPKNAHTKTKRDEVSKGWQTKMSWHQRGQTPQSLVELPRPKNNNVISVRPSTKIRKRRSQTHTAPFHITAWQAYQ